MRTKLLLSLAVACLPAFAQGKFEAQGFVGNMYGGSVSTNTVNALGINKISMNSSISYGLTAGMNFGDHMGAEFLWNHQPTQAVAHFASGVQPIKTPNVDVSNNQYHGNFLFYFKPADSKFRPYALVGFGATNSSGNNSSVTKFSYGLGGGLKYYFSDNIGVRVQARYAPTYLYTSNGGLWCNWYGYCWVIGNDHYLNQGDVTVGITFRFGH